MPFRLLILTLLLVAAPLTATASAADPFGVAGQPVAYILCGGSAAWNVCPAANKCGMHGFVALAREIGPKLREKKYTRVLFHNPCGIFIKGWLPDPNDGKNGYGEIHQTLTKKYGVAFTREMWVDQFQLAASIGMKCGSRDDLRAAAAIFRRHGIKEIIWYIGSPESLTDPLVDGKPCIEPFLVPGCSLAFDHSFGWRSGDKMSQLFDWIRGEGEGRRVYVEPRLSVKLGREFVRTGKHARHIDGTIAEASYDASQREDMKAAAQFGEVLRITQTPPKEDWPAGVTPVIAETVNVVPGMWHEIGGQR